MTSGFISDENLSNITGLFPGDYAVVRCIESGGSYSVITLCRKRGRLFAVKSLKEEFRNDHFYISLLEKEFEIAYELDHPNIYKVIEFTDINTLGPAIVMEYIDGMTLKDFIKDGLLTPTLLFKVANELCSAMVYFHKKQVIHRDIKPENVIITNNGNNAKLIDFGFSDTDSFELLKLPAGTSFYASPEQIRGELLDQRSDIYSFGVMISSIIREGGYPKIYEKVVRKCVSPDKERRFDNASLIIDLLRENNTAVKQGLSIKSIFVQAGIFVVIVFTTLLFIKHSGNDRNPQKASFSYYSDSIGEKKTLLSLDNNRPTKTHKREINTVNKNSNEMELTNVYYSCYNKIEEYIKKFSSLLRLKYTVSLDKKIPSLMVDSLNASKELRSIIDNEYMHLADSRGEHSIAMKNNSNDWALSSLSKVLERFRSEYITSLKSVISDSFIKSPDKSGFSSPEDWYKSEFPGTAHFNLLKSGEIYRESD
ncbi:MAG: serine/threonine-protein kinase [Rikenellaceae bacterium]|nr:serine/threonine-protein kinase [Rikenellaceae bacterium]